MPPIQYVKGETRYMKSQKPGSRDGGCNTPLKRMLMSVSSDTRPDAVSASGSAAMVMAAKVEV